MSDWPRATDCACNAVPCACGPMTEPSQEAVELIRAEVSRRRGACYCNVDPHCSVCREAEEVVAIARPALRAVEQRTRLETLNERLSDLRYYAEKIGNDIAALEIQRASLQLRKIGCCDACWCQGRCIKPECECHPVEPREAPKAEEPLPKSEAEHHSCECVPCGCSGKNDWTYCDCRGVCSCHWAAPQPGPEEGR